MFKRISLMVITLFCALIIQSGSGIAEAGNDYFVGIDESGNNAYIVLDSVKEIKESEGWCCMCHGNWPNDRENIPPYYSYELKVKSVKPNSQIWHYDNYHVYAHPHGKGMWSIIKNGGKQRGDYENMGNAERNIGTYFYNYYMTNRYDAWYKKHPKGGIPH